MALNSVMSLVVSWLLSRVTAIKTSTYKEMFLPLCYCVQNIPVRPYACSVEDNAPSSTTICSQTPPHVVTFILTFIIILFLPSLSYGLSLTRWVLSASVKMFVCVRACVSVCVRDET